MNRLIGVVFISSLLLSGCVTPGDPLAGGGLDNGAAEPAAGDGQQPIMDGSATPIAGSDTEASALIENTLTAQQMLEQQDSPIASRVIYFDYDSAKVNDESMALLEAHGDFIASNGNVNVTLTGHSDERGSREYNIALGDRRAQSVRRILLFQGASTDQLESVSYGEERPAVLGHEEAAWSKNRRVELEYVVR